MHSSLVFLPPWELNFSLPSKSPSFKTLIQTPASGRGEIRASLQPYPIWTIEYSLEYARGHEQMSGSVYQYVTGFYIASGGQASDFLYLDPNDNHVDVDLLGIGDGATTTFQLVRQIGPGTDIVQNLSPTDPPIISVDNVVVSNWTMGAWGIVQFSAPPASGSVVTWSGGYYYRVRFADDAMAWDQMVYQMWSQKSLKLVGVIL